MKNSTTQELTKAINEGFIDSFEFQGGRLSSTIAATLFYYPKDIQINPIPCYVTKQIVYHINTPK